MRHWSNVNNVNRKSSNMRVKNNNISHYSSEHIFYDSTEAHLAAGVSAWSLCTEQKYSSYFHPRGH